jgi:hypothetical protein
VALDVHTQIVPDFTTSSRTTTTLAALDAPAGAAAAEWAKAAGEDEAALFGWHTRRAAVAGDRPTPLDAPAEAHSAAKSISTFFTTSAAAAVAAAAGGSMTDAIPTALSGTPLEASPWLADCAAAIQAQVIANATAATAPGRRGRRDSEGRQGAPGADGGGGGGSSQHLEAEVARLSTLVLQHQRAAEEATLARREAAELRKAQEALEAKRAQERTEYEKALRALEGERTRLRRELKAIQDPVLLGGSRDAVTATLAGAGGGDENAGVGVPSMLSRLERNDLRAAVRHLTDRLASGGAAAATAVPSDALASSILLSGASKSGGADGGLADTVTLNQPGGLESTQVFGTISRGDTTTSFAASSPARAGKLVRGGSINTTTGARYGFATPATAAVLKKGHVLAEVRRLAAQRQQWQTFTAALDERIQIGHARVAEELAFFEL